MHKKFDSHIPCQSVLLSTIVFNDYHVMNVWTTERSVDDNIRICGA